LWEYKKKKRKIPKKERRKRKKEFLRFINTMTLSNVKRISWRIYVREWILFSVESINLTSLMNSTRNDTVHKGVGREDVKNLKNAKYYVCP
jgi:hypothetical protein